MIHNTDTPCKHVEAVQWIPACALLYGIAKAANDIVVRRKLAEDLRHMDWWSTDKVCLSKHPKDAVWGLWCIRKFYLKAFIEGVMKLQGNLQI